MTAKEFLSQYRATDLRIKSKLDQIAQLRALTTKCTQTLSGMPHGGGDKDWTDIAVKVMEMEHELIDELDQLHQIKRDVSAAISAIEDSSQRTVLELRYINGWSWNRIAMEMAYDRTSIWRIHGAALKSCNVVQH